MRIRKEDREVVKKLYYQGVDFPVSKKDYGKIEILNKINISMFCYENKVVYPVYLSNQLIKQGIKVETTFAKVFYSVFLLPVNKQRTKCKIIERIY